jgi:hypothetical protein
MTNVETLTTSTTTGNGWDRPPAPQTMRSVRRAQERRARAMKGIVLALGQKPRGCNQAPLERARKISELYSEYVRAGLRILEGELL